MFELLESFFSAIADILSIFKWRTMLMIVAGIIVLFSGFNKFCILGFFLVALILYSPEVWRFISTKQKLKKTFS